MSKLKASPTCARLIIISHGTEEYRIVPGGKASKYVTVPKEVLDMPFVQHLIDDGMVIASTANNDSDEVSEIDELRQRCKDLGIRYNGKHGAEKLRQLIAEVEEE